MYAGSFTQSPQATAPPASALSPSAPPSADSNAGAYSPTEERKSSHSGANGLNARSCVTCRRRKVKCDKQVPCTNCKKAQTQCVFPAPGRAPRRPRQGKLVTEREAELLKRLRRLEGVVEELSGQVDFEAVKNSPASDHSHKDGESPGGSTRANSVRVVGMDEGTGTRKAWVTRAFNLGAGPPKTAFGTDRMQQSMGRLVLDEGKTSFVANPFWATLSEQEVEEIRDILEEPVDYDSEDESNPILPSDTVTDASHQSFIMGYNSSSVNLQPLHPLPSQIPFYWQTFLENVQPLVKILHTQTMDKTIKEVLQNLDSLSPSTEALMFSIYFATITSMNEDEVRMSFGVEKSYLIKQYRFGVEQALAKAGFLNTDEIVTVQALVLFLVCVRRHDDTRFVWSMAGLALRIAQSLGLHRDGSKFGLSPFDTEMRRRLWWQVCILDVRASEDHGSDPSILDQAFDTEMPLSVNDSDLDPDATEPPTPRHGVSEMTFCLIRYEICSLTRQLSYTPPGSFYQARAALVTLEDKEQMIKDCADRLEEKYLQYCEEAGPLYWVAATVARLITAKMSLIIYHPLTQPGKPSPLSQDTKDRLFMASIEIIEYSSVLKSEASTKQWGWLFHTYVQWHAIAYILGELCIRPHSMIVDRAWRAVDGVFSDFADAVSHSKGRMLWLPMRKLMAKARRKREENMQAQSEHGRISNDLGMNSQFIRPPPSGPTSSRRVAGDRLHMQTTDTTNMIANQKNEFHPTPIQSPSTNNGNPFPTQQNYAHDIPMSEPQIQPQVIGMGPRLAPEQIQLQMQQQQRQMQQTPWLLDDSALVDLDMAGLDGDPNWEGWDDLVKDFQMEADNAGGLGEIRGPALGGMGSWW
ncbi:Bikaverin cluster transcription factor bik5 [Hyphodiscus hymeniophilus]|uniref:Bikaverin cluster transcription factor bik5 n=1 Tax=Hyphodiscus hymeniophilus TaxID=353542 RepID=A0A9P6VNN9_9HELO|nr:Bikaverin cluster transcription factor bik5 [Hyphodiscus hymeniophilus]